MTTKIEELKDVGVQEVSLPGFTPGVPFVVKLSRPSLIRLAREGEIPNSLLGSAARLFTEGSGKLMQDGEGFVELSKAITFLAKASLVEPSYDELASAGIELTDAQLMDIYLYTQQGVRALDGFRTEQESEPDSESVGGKRKRSK